jgi:hypothetical protein
LKKMSKDIEIWKSQGLNNCMDSLYKRFYKIYKDSLYIKLPMLRSETDSLFPSDSLLLEIDSSISTQE